MLLASAIKLIPETRAEAIDMVVQVGILMGVFLVVAVSLNFLVFQPVLRILKLRRSKTSGDRIRLEELSAQTEALIKEYEAKMAEAKGEAFAVKETIRKEGELQGQRMIQEARAANHAQIEKLKEEIQNASRKAGKELERESEVLSRSIAEKVLGRSLEQ